jgi:uncharacterized LabA/DUF88 family protein/cold shock CspA family protein
MAKAILNGKNLLDILRIGIFYDGYYFYKISNYYKYEHDKKARISINGLHEFIRNEVSMLTSTDMRQCQIIDAHYFKGRSTGRDLGDKVQNERVFEDILMRENIVSHYLPLRYNENNVAQEKGIDVWLALEAYELAIYKHFDVLVLIAGDGDYVPLVRKLHTVGTQVMLLSWDFTFHNENGDLVETRTSRALQEEVFYHVPMHQRVEQESNEYIKKLFVADRNTQEHYTIGSAVRLPGYGGGAPASPAVDPSSPLAVEHTSTIFSINPNGFGFIRDEERNNIFFHYSTVTNREWTDLCTGMKVRYWLEEDVERTNRDEVPRYRACKVTVCDE